MYRLLYNIVIYIFEMLIAFAFFSRAYEKRLKKTHFVLLVGCALFIPSAFVFELLNHTILPSKFALRVLCFEVENVLLYRKS